MHWRRKVVTAGAMMFALVGCSDRVASPSAADAERAVLSGRVQALAASVTQSGRMTEVQQRERDDIKQEIVAWQGRTGRRDLGFSSASHARPLTTVEAINRGPGQSPTPSCSPCPPVKVFADRICFLDSSSCGSPGDPIQRVCHYTCIWS